MSRTGKIALVLGGGFGALVFWAVIYHTLFGDDGANHAAAKLKINTIEQALVGYKVSHGEYPQALNELTVSDDDNRKPPLEPRDILDPWGHPFRYDPSICQPATGKPRISTVTPDGEELSNW